jgi:hypothetical protein
MNEGRHDGMPMMLCVTRECDPDVPHAGGVPVVVRGRESLPHGEGEQFKRLFECKLADHREVKTFDNQ